jgi:hypothetical protein
MGFFSDFTGASARSDIKKANNTATAALDQGYNTSQGYYDQAASSFDPYTSSGAAGQKMYGDLLGINGDDARSSAQGIITSDPLWSGKLGEDTNAVLKNLNARGMGASGASALAGQRVLLQNYNSVLDRYQGLGQTGLSATGQRAGVLTGQGDNAYGFGATKANQALQYGNAMAGTRNTGLNNVLAVLGTGAKAYAAYAGGGKV